MLKTMTPPFAVGIGPAQSASPSDSGVAEAGSAAVLAIPRVFRACEAMWQRCFTWARRSGALHISKTCRNQCQAGSAVLNNLRMEHPSRSLSILQLSSCSSREGLLVSPRRRRGSSALVMLSREGRVSPCRRRDYPSPCFPCSRAVRNE